MSISKDLQIVGLMIKFVRTKRRLSQQEVANLAGINRAIVSLVESANIEKTGLNPVNLIFGALRMHESSLGDPSLYQLIKNEKNSKVTSVLEKEYAEKADKVMKICSAVIDSYCSILPWTVNLEIAKKSRHYKPMISSPGVKEALELRIKIWEEAAHMGKPIVKIDILDYLPSFFILDLLSHLSRQDLLDIFSIADNTFVSNDEIFESKIIEDVLSQDPLKAPLDPFKKFMEKIGVKHIDYFRIIDLIVFAAGELRKSSFNNFPENVKYVVSNIDEIMRDAAQ